MYITYVVLRAIKKGVSRLGTITGELQESNALMGVCSLFNKFPTDAAPATPATKSGPQNDRLYVNVLLILASCSFDKKSSFLKIIFKSF